MILTILQLQAIDDGLGPGHGDGVDQGGLSQVVIDQGRYDASLGQANPGDESDDWIVMDRKWELTMWPRIQVDCS